LFYYQCVLFSAVTDKTLLLVRFLSWRVSREVLKIIFLNISSDSIFVYVVFVVAQQWHVIVMI